ncbi:MAG: hypothetical protein KA521_01560 [Crocinitomicaceae bacterium]|nr:hypothetical protein [Crocinitomicaceae bacterium]
MNLHKSLLIQVLIGCFFALYSFEQSQPICDINGKLFIGEAELLSAFNSLTNENALKIGFTFDQDLHAHFILFIKDNSTVTAVELEKVENSYVINAMSHFIYHSCVGEQNCSIQSTWYTTVKCSRNQSSCDTCKCNHTVNETIGINEELTGKDLDEALIAL